MSFFSLLESVFFFVTFYDVVDCLNFFLCLFRRVGRGKRGGFKNDFIFFLHLSRYLIFESDAIAITILRHVFVYKYSMLYELCINMIVIKDCSKNIFYT